MKAGLAPAFFFSFILLSLPLRAGHEVKLLGPSSYWYKLLHYKKGLLGYTSEVDAKEFFLHPDGKKNPGLELSATISQSHDQSTVCRFPARYHWLNEQGLTKADTAKCSDYKAWKDGLKAKGLTLVFASYYPENPASAFGHLFLKINGERPENPELDYVVNFSAAAFEDGGIMYALKGLLGGYKGIYTIEKYYQKIQEYELHETRDLWEFHLKFTQVEIDRVIDHLWELTYSAYFDYYFLDENCSYQLMKLLELAKGETYDSSWGPYQIPEENLHQVVDSVGLVNLEIVRHSLFKKTEARIKLLNSIERRQFNQIRKGKTVNLDQLSIQTLDTLYNYYLLKESQNKGLSTEDKKLRHSILRQIAKKETPPEVPLPKTHSPLSGHRSFKIALGAGAYEEQAFASLKVKPAFHDLMDDDRGYLPNSSLNLMQADVRYYEKSQTIKLNELVILETQVFVPYSFLSTKPSWAVDFSIRSPLIFNCDFCKTSQIKASRGLSFSLFEDLMVPYILLHGQLQMLLHEAQNLKRFRYGPELEAGIILRPFEKIKNKSSLSQIYNFNDQWGHQAYLLTNQLNYSLTQTFALGLDYKLVLDKKSNEIRSEQESSLNLNFFF